MKLLIVDDDRQFRETTARRLQRADHDVVDVPSGAEALACVTDEHFDVALIDLMMPGMSGLELLGRFKEAGAPCEVVVLTGEATIQSAVSAMKQGAFDYVTKPCPFDELQLILDRAHETYRLRKENSQLSAALKRGEGAADLIGESPPIKHVLRLIEKVAPTESPVLILGESGTGKELAARAIHRLSVRADKPIVTINCAALQESLLESELFGHEKGSFTGATQAKMGLFEVADGGTLFVDELGELHPSLQAKLLRVLEDGHLRRVGATREQKVDVRIVAATNKDLAAEVDAKRFRDDLYYRLNVFTIRMPPVRESVEDLPLLIAHLLRRCGAGHWSVASDALQAMALYDWPGNVRELSNVIERATVLADGTTIRVDDLPSEISHAEVAGTSGRPSVQRDVDGDVDNLAERERRHVERVLQREHYNRIKAAKVLGITRRSLFRLIEKYAIPVPGKCPSEREYE